MTPSAPYAGQRVLVTGGLGFIGSNLVHALAQVGAQVTVVDALVPEHGGDRAHLEGLEGAVDVHVLDVRDQQAMTPLVEDQAFIFHLAGQVSHQASMEDPHRDLALNAEATLALLETCRHHNPSVRIVFTSTRQVYGRLRTTPVDESHPVAPVDINGVNKHLAETYLQLYHHTHGVRSATLRLTNTYGPRQRIDSPSLGFLGFFVHRALHGAPLQVFGTGDQRRDFNHVDDVVAALLLAGTTEACFGGRWNLGGLASHRLVDVVETLGQLLPLVTERVPYPADRASIEIGDYHGDHGAFTQVTGWRPRISLEEGLRRTLRYHQALEG